MPKGQRRKNGFTVKITGMVTLTANQLVFWLVLVGVGVGAIHQR